jgi:hypothetical protein
VTSSENKALIIKHKIENQYDSNSLLKAVRMLRDLEKIKEEEIDEETY